MDHQSLLEVNQGPCELVVFMSMFDHYNFVDIEHFEQNRVIWMGHLKLPLIKWKQAV